MRIEVVTLFPEFVAAGGARRRAGPRDRSAGGSRCTRPRRANSPTDVHRTVDDRPYGGGPGMVLKIEPTRTAIRAAKARLPAGSRSIYLAADGERADAREGARAGAAAGADAAGGTLRRRRRAIDRVGDRRERVDRRLRVVGRRVAGAGADRCGRALAAGRARRRRVGSSRTRSRTVCSTGRTTRGPRCSRDARCRKCWRAAITPRSGAGAPSRRWAGRGCGGRS